MKLTRISAVLIAGMVVLGGAISAQTMVSANISFNYREPLPADGSQAQARAKIMAQADKDCEVASKAFGRKCVINNINFNNQMNNNNQQSGPALTANVNAQLLADPPGNQ